MGAALFIRFSKQPFKAVLDNDLKALAAAGEKGLVELLMTSHAGMSTADFEGAGAAR
jgi:hypothetical protein